MFVRACVRVRACVCAFEPDLMDLSFVCVCVFAYTCVCVSVCDLMYPGCCVCVSALKCVCMPQRLRGGLDAGGDSSNSR